MSQNTRYIRIILGLIAIITGNLIHGSVCAQNIESKIDEYMRTHVEQGNFSGTVLVSKSGKVIACNSYGMANYEHDIPNSPQTKFQIGSMSKSFTAFAIMLLENSKLLSFDDTLAKYLPDFPGGQDITIHHLLTHPPGTYFRNDLVMRDYGTGG